MLTASHLVDFWLQICVAADEVDSPGASSAQQRFVAALQVCGARGYRNGCALAWRQFVCHGVISTVCLPLCCVSGGA